MRPDGLDKIIGAKDDLTSGFRHLPMQDLEVLKDNLAPYYYEWLAHPQYDDYWNRVSIEESHSDITVPAFNYGGWYDIFLGGTLRNFVRMRKMGATEGARNGPEAIDRPLDPWRDARQPLR